jgi:hypothetical protein
VTIDPVQLGKAVIALGALAGAAWAGFGWIDVQNRDVAALPPIEQLARETADVARQLAERNLAQQIAMEMECEDPESDLPRSYCRDVLREKRIRERAER